MADPTDPILPSNIDDFVTSMRSGGHLLNSRYSVEFTSMPPIISSAVLRNFGDMRQFASAFSKRTIQVSGPNLSIATSTQKITGVDYEHPYQRNFENDIALTMISDKQMALRNVFIDWINGIQAPFTGTWGFRDSYTTNLIIKYLDRSDNETLGYRIREVFPKTITGIQSSADSDALTTFTVTMSFKDFSVETPPNLSGPPLSAPPPPTNPIEPGGVPPLENLGDVDALIAGL